MNEGNLSPEPLKQGKFEEQEERGEEGEEEGKGEGKGTLRVSFSFPGD